MPSQNQKHKLTYFRPGQLTFLGTHPNQAKPTYEQIEGLFSKCREVLKELGYDQAQLKRRSVVSFPATRTVDCYKSSLPATKSPAFTGQDEFSLIFADITGVDDDPIRFFWLITTLDEKLLRWSIDEFTLKVISPNWLASGAPPEGSGSGGPGGWPVAYRGASERAPYQFINLPDTVTKSRKGEGVDVVILDTAPSPQDLTEAYNEWQGKHPLIRSLLRPNGPLRVTNNPNLDTQVQVRGHEYKMTDHGLFVAGIVHTIAPCAGIHLIEVLNPYGVGDLESITSGLEQAVRLIQNNPDRSFVVNCSLVVTLPLAEQHCYTRLEEDEYCFVDLYLELDRELERIILNKVGTLGRTPGDDSEWLVRQRSTLEDPCNDIYDLNSRVIAAAGNDRKPGRRDREQKPGQEDRPQARYPAALQNVQGVGALPRDSASPGGRHRTASYSNRADKPERIGITTLGGEEGEGQGVLGLYLGEFPGGEANCTKWAWWAGTSFATPITSGVTAAVLSGLPRPRATQEAIDELYRTRIIQEEPKGTVDKEDVLEMTQG